MLLYKQLSVELFIIYLYLHKNMKKTFELTNDGKVKIIEETIKTSERVIELSAVQRRIDEVTSQIEVLNAELDDLKNIKKVKKNEKLEVDIKI